MATCELDHPRGLALNHGIRRDIVRNDRACHDDRPGTDLGPRATTTWAPSHTSSKMHRLLHAPHVRNLITRAGCPCPIAPGGKSPETTEPAETIAPGPMRAPRKTATCVPSQTSSKIRIGACVKGCCRIGSPAAMPCSDA